jgi:hypothetical protein
VPTPTYRRGQAEWALWRMFDFATHAQRPMPGVFRTRIKRLLDIDRAGAMAGVDRRAAALAFADEAPSGSGAEAAFGAFDVFCLALALDLLDMGFKQAEIVFLMRHVRAGLRSVFMRIVADYPPPDRQRRRVQDFPNCPGLPGEPRFVDAGVYLILNKLELTELMPQRVKGPVIAPPQICYGREELAAGLAELGAGQRKALVLEIGLHARLAPRLLDKAPEVKRGRPR